MVKKFNEMNDTELKVYVMFDISHSSNIVLIGAYNKEDAREIAEQQYNNIEEINLVSDLQTTKHGFIRNCDSYKSDDGFVF